MVKSEHTAKHTKPNDRDKDKARADQRREQWKTETEERPYLDTEGGE
jgi:hypothetical protein